MTEMTDGLPELEAAIRELINQPRRRGLLLREASKWYKLCSSLDVIGDTEVALDGYLSAPEPGDDGQRYILIYGALQSLMVQQDAVRTLREALGIGEEPDPVLFEIREVRNYAIGHPTKRGRGEGDGFSFITRVSMTKETFTLTTFFREKGTMHREVSVPELIARQRERLAEVLRQTKEHIEKEDHAHKREFAGKSIRARFPPLLGYHLSKLSGFDPESPDWMLLKANYDFLDGVLFDFKKDLAARQLDGTLDGVEYVINELSYAWEQMRDFLTNPQTSRLTPRDMEIFARFVGTHFLELAAMADEIDRMYAGIGLAT